MKKLYSIFAAAAVIGGSLFFCGCAVVSGEQLGNHNKDPRFIVIGAVLPLSGPDAVYGERMLSGLRFAEFELNSRRGISGKRMKLLPFDSKGTAEGAEIAFESAVAAGAEGVIAGYSTVEANAIAPLANGDIGCRIRKISCSQLLYRSAAGRGSCCLPLVLAAAYPHQCADRLRF